MRFFELGFSPFAYFAAGVVFSLAIAGLWRAAQFFFDLLFTRARAKSIEKSGSRDELTVQAWKEVSACRKRLRLNPNPNPEWIAPLIEEVPKLIREIAVIYYPDHPEPVQAPRISEFARAVQFVAMDIAELLQSRRVGRLIDVSAGSTVQAWRTGHRLWRSPKVQKARSFLEPAYKVAKPLWQVLRLKSPITWISFAASNAAVRTIHPAVINIIARRAIDLYGGKLEEPEIRDSSGLDAPNPEDPLSDTAIEGAASHKPPKKYRLWRSGH